MWATIIAVAGTLLGGIVTSALQTRATRAIRDAESGERRRDAQLAAVTALVAAIGDHRRAMWRREDLRLAGADADTLAAARSQSHVTRSAVTAPLVSVSVLAPDLAEVATAAARAAFGIRQAVDTDELATLRQTAIDASDQLVKAASRRLA
ncbi:protein kilB [Streptomyces sp. NPDC002701]|uniref:protein kilB n=1 Tax=Streptomyces sp. NPDC002701 TaxID=3364661 RepID=UPI0036B8C8A0